MESQEPTLVDKMLSEQNNKIETLKLQLSKLYETMEGLKTDYNRKHNDLIIELNKAIGSTETLTKIKYAQEESGKAFSDNNSKKL